MTDTSSIQPVLSIIVPNYNSRQYIRELIDSVISQDFKDWEMIMVDDNSTDGSDKIIEEYLQADSRIRLLRRPDSNAGACQRRNQGMREAKGKYIAFFDSDDILPEGSLRRRVEALEARPELDFVVTPAISFSQRPFDLKQLVLGIPLFKDDLAMFISRYRLPFGVWNNTYRLDFFKRTGLEWDENLRSLQDSDLNIRSIEAGAKYAYADSDNPSYFWRIGGNPNSITKLIERKENLHSQIYFFEKLSQRYSNTEYEPALRAFALTLLLRCAACGEKNIPASLIRNRNWKWRFSILSNIYRNSLIRKLSTLVNLSFFPVSLGKQYLFVLRNRKVCKEKISGMIGYSKEESVSHS